MFEIGDKIICVNNHNATVLVIDEKYVVISCNKADRNIWVKSSDGTEVHCYEYRFIKLTDLRKDKLNKICSKMVKY